MMRSMRWAVLAMASACVQAASPHATLEARSEALQAAESAMDVARIMPFWADDAVIQGNGQPAMQGREAISAGYTGFFKSGVKVLQGTPVSLVESPDHAMAYEVGTNHMVFSTPNGDMEDNGKYLLVWRRIHGDWVASALSFTSDQPAPRPLAGK